MDPTIDMDDLEATTLEEDNRFKIALLRRILSDNGPTDLVRLISADQNTVRLLLTEGARKADRTTEHYISCLRCHLYGHTSGQCRADTASEAPKHPPYNTNIPISILTGRSALTLIDITTILLAIINSLDIHAPSRLFQPRLQHL